MVSAASSQMAPTHPHAPASGAAHVDSGVFEVLAVSSAAGLALFDAQYRLIYANPAYIRLCNHAESDVVAGASMQSLIRASLIRAGATAFEAAQIIPRAIRKLETSRGYRFRADTPGLGEIHVERKLLADDRVLETVNSEALEDVADSQMRVVADTARSQMAHAMESMADGFVLFDADDRLVAFNEQYIDLSPGITDLIRPGVSCETLFRTEAERDSYELKGINPHRFVEWRMKQHNDPGQAYDLQLRDGRWVRIHERRTGDGGVVGIRSDITALKSRETEIMRVSSALTHRNMLFDTAISNMNQGLCMFDSGQTLVVSNQQYLDLYGFSGEVIKPGVTLDQIIDYSVELGRVSAVDAERAREERRKQAGARKRGTTKQLLRSGRIIAVMYEPMETGGSIVTYQDVTEIERAQRDLEKYNRQLEVSNRELQDFAYVASHDLQEPLRKIETFGDRLAKKYCDELPDGGKLYIERMQNATSRMRLLINDLLGYSRVTTKAKPFAQVDLAECVAGVIDDLQMRVEETGASISFEALPVIDADRTQMRQLFQNLIGNALKFQKEGVAPEVTVSGQTIETAPGRTDMLEIRIADNGIGFDNKYKAQIFTIFQRLHGRNEYEGTGIGLATVRKIVERHNGTIDADGVDGEGATFTVTLPLEQVVENDTISEDTIDA